MQNEPELPRHSCGNYPKLIPEDEYDEGHGCAYLGTTYSIQCKCGLKTIESRNKDLVLNIWLNGVNHQ